MSSQNLKKHALNYELPNKEQYFFFTQESCVSALIEEITHTRTQ
jgi:hypothetical protein